MCYLMPCFASACLAPPMLRLVQARAGNAASQPSSVSLIGDLHYMSGRTVLSAGCGVEGIVTRSVIGFSVPLPFLPAGLTMENQLLEVLLCRHGLITSRLCSWF